MKSIATHRNSSKLSQRQLATKAGISYKALQLLESEGHNATITTLNKIAEAFHYPQQSIKHHIAEFFSLPENSIAIISRQILDSKNDSWKIPFFNFVDHFRLSKDPLLVTAPPHHQLPHRFLALLASATETLCHELNLPVPRWCIGIEHLREPYFVAGIENLKPMTLVESPAHFRKRNIFVLANFLDRA